MFCINLWGFSIDPLLLVYNSAEHETPVLCIFKFQVPYGTQTERKLFAESIFFLEIQYEDKKYRRRHNNPSEWVNCSKSVFLYFIKKESLKMET
jgi:hypothetical protein